MSEQEIKVEKKDIANEVYELVKEVGYIKSSHYVDGRLIECRIHLFKPIGWTRLNHLLGLGIITFLSTQFDPTLNQYVVSMVLDFRK